VAAGAHGSTPSAQGLPVARGGAAARPYFYLSIIYLFVDLFNESKGEE
jgi:hypothetical protein